MYSSTAGFIVKVEISNGDKVDSREQGKNGEKILDMACDHLLKTWEHLAYHFANRSLDNGGIDRLLILKSGFAFALNSKTSQGGIDAHFKHKNRSWYKHIHPILITPEEVANIHKPENIQRVAARVKAKILEACQKIKEEPLPI